MRCLTVLVHTDDAHELVRMLGRLPIVNGFTLMQVEGHGTEVEKDAFMASLDRALGTSPRTRVDIVLADGAESEVIESLNSAKTKGVIRGGYYWVAELAKEGRI